MTDEQFNNFVDSCYDKLEAKSAILFGEYKIGTYDKYWFDQDMQTLQFKNGNNVEIEFEFICIGTLAHKKDTWMWAWANESFSDEIRKKSEALKSLKLLTGYDLFESSGFVCDKEMAYELTAMGVETLNSLGMYKIPGEKSDLFLALKGVKKNEI